MRRLRLVSAAEEELAEAALFYESRGKNVAALFLCRIEEAFRSIQENPRAAPVLYESARRKIVTQFPYALIYQEGSDEIVVISVMHMHRNPGYWKNRL